MSTSCIVILNGYGAQTRLPSRPAMPNSAPKQKAFYCILLILCLPNLPLHFLPIFQWSFPSQYLDYSFSEAKTTFFVVSLYSNWHIIILSCWPLRSTCCALRMYQLSWSSFWFINTGLPFTRGVQESLYCCGETLLLPGPWYCLMTNTSKKV